MRSAQLTFLSDSTNSRVQHDGWKSPTTSEARVTPYRPGFVTWPAFPFIIIIIPCHILFLVHREAVVIADHGDNYCRAFTLLQHLRRRKKATSICFISAVLLSVRSTQPIWNALLWGIYLEGLPFTHSGTRQKFWRSGRPSTDLKQ